MPAPTPDAARFAEVSRWLLSGEDSEDVLRRVVDLAVQTIEGCDYAGVTLRHDGKLHTPACTDPVVAEADTIQYVLQQGPCVDAVWEEDTYCVHDLLEEDRWPDWAPAAVKLGLRSSLSVRLSTDHRIVGGLNLYSKEPGAFDHDDIATAHVYALHASGAIRQSQEAEGLRVALRTRHDIGVAQGMIMARLDVDQDVAFQVLRRISQNNNVKLHQVATAIIEHRGKLDALPWKG